MVFCVVQHLSETIVPNIFDILGLLSKGRSNVLIPENVFFELRSNTVFAAPFEDWRELVSYSPSLPRFGKGFLADKSFEMLVNCLSGDREVLRSNFTYVIWMLFDMR